MLSQFSSLFSNDNAILQDQLVTDTTVHGEFGNSSAACKPVFQEENSCVGSIDSLFNTIFVISDKEIETINGLAPLSQYLENVSLDDPKDAYFENINVDSIEEVGTETVENYSLIELLTLTTINANNDIVQSLNVDDDFQELCRIIESDPNSYSPEDIAMEIDSVCLHLNTMQDSICDAEETQSVAINATSVTDQSLNGSDSLCKIAASSTAEPEQDSTICDVTELHNIEKKHVAGYNNVTLNSSSNNERTYNILYKNLLDPRPDQLCNATFIHSNETVNSEKERPQKRKNSTDSYASQSLQEASTGEDSSVVRSCRGFNVNQIKYFVHIANKNKDVYRQFIANYHKLVGLNDLSVDLSQELSSPKIIDLRSFTIRSNANKYITKFVTRESYDENKLHTDFTAYHLSNNVLSIEKEARTRDEFFKSLYISYECGDAVYCVTNYELLPLNVYRHITDNIVANSIDREKNLLYTNKLFMSIGNFPIRLKNEMCIRKLFVYNLLLYASTNLDSNNLTDQNYENQFKLEIKRIFTQYLLPEEVDYIHVLVFLSYLKNNNYKKTIFVKKLNKSKYIRSVAFYHFRYLYYVFYNIHRVSSFKKKIFQKLNMDFPGSLSFFNNVVDRFLTNTFYLLIYKNNIIVDVYDVDAKFKLLDYILANGMKYLNKEVSQEQQLENLLNDTISVLNLKKINE